MDRNSIIGLLLIGLVLIGFTFWNQPSAEEKAAIKRAYDSAQSVAAAQAVKQKSATQQPVAVAETLPTDSTLSSDSLKNVVLTNKFGAFAGAAEGTEKFFTLENKLIKVTFTNKGGRVYAVELKNYKTFNQKPLILFHSDTTLFGLNFFALNRDIATNNLFFEPIQNKPGAISFRLKTSGIGYVDYVYRLPEDGYLLDFSINLSNMDKVIASNISYLELNWRENIYKLEKSVQAERNSSTIYYKYPTEKADYLSETKDDKETLPTKVKWVSFKQQYFNTTLIAKTE